MHRETSTRRELGRRAAVAALVVVIGLLGAVPVTDVGILRSRPEAEARSVVPLAQAQAGRQPGYQLVTDVGDVHPFGNAPVGSAPTPPATGVAGVAWTADGDGHWLATRDGGVFTFGNARFFGSAGATRLMSPLTGIASTRTGDGYWLVAADGGVFAFGDAKFHGSLGGRAASRIVAIAPTRSGDGYWLAAADGGIFTFGDAKFHGAASSLKPLRAPIVAIGTTRSGKGYWLAGADGGVFAFGDAKFHGSIGRTQLNSPVVGLATTRTGRGYWLAAADGGVFAFGDAPFLGSSGKGVWGTVVGIAGGATRPATVSAATAERKSLTTRFGHDISWPQCDGPFPNPGYGYAIIGVTGGRPFRENRCLATEWRWATAHGSGGGLYVNLAAPVPGEPAAMHGPAGDCAGHDLPCQFYNHSANNMLYALGVAERAAADAPMWWLDVEVLNHWDHRRDLNALVVKAAAETLEKAGKRVGLYSTYLMWRRITGDASFGLPIWVAGAPNDRQAPSWCDGRKSFNGGQTWLVQALPVQFDNNFACDPVTADPNAVFAFRD